MGIHLSISNFKMNKILLLTISMMLTLAGCFYLNSKPFSPKFEQEINETSFWVNKVHQSKKYKGLILGDSRGLRGINPDLIGKIPNLYNFSFRSSTLTIDYLSEALKLVGDDGVILVALTPNSLVRVMNPNAHYKEYKYMSMDEVFIKKNKTLYRLFSPFRDRKFDLNSTPEFTKVFFENGFVATNTDLHSVNVGVEIYKKRFMETRIDLDLLRDFLKMATQSKKKFIFFRMPSCIEMEKVENEFSGFDNAAVKELVESAGFKWLDFNERFTFPTYDGSHLTPKAAGGFSEVLNEGL